MDQTRWTRDPTKVHASLVQQPGGSVVTSQECKIYIPERFIEKQLAKISNEIYIVGIFGIVVDDKYYGVSTVNAMMRITPTSIRTVKFDDDSYLEFYFEPGSQVIATVELIMQATLVYKIFDEIIARGRAPWYIDYNDLAKLFMSSKRHAGVNFSNSHAILEMFAAAIARDSADKTKYYRHTVKSQDEIVSRPPAIIALRNITHGATNTTAKLLGSYWNEGLNSALVNPSEKVEAIEELLRR